MFTGADRYAASRVDFNRVAVSRASALRKGFCMRVTDMQYKTRDCAVMMPFVRILNMLVLCCRLDTG